MGPDSPFKAFIRLLLDDMKDVKAETDEEKKDEKLVRIIDNPENPGGLK